MPSNYKITRNILSVCSSRISPPSRIRCPLIVMAGLGAITLCPERFSTLGYGRGNRDISDQHRHEHHRRPASSAGSAPWSNSGVGFHPRVGWSDHQGPLLAGGRRPPRHWHGGRQCGYRVQPSPQGRADGPWPKPKSNSGCFFLTCFSKNHFRNWLCRAHGVP